MNEKKAENYTNGFRLTVDALKLNGVTTIYGVAGIPITDLARIAQRSGIRYIGFRHEASAGNATAIAGYLTQKPGICLTVSAPGFLNGMVALANATTNCFPMIQISGSSKPKASWTSSVATMRNSTSTTPRNPIRRRPTASTEPPTSDSVWRGRSARLCRDARAASISTCLPVY